MLFVHCMSASNVHQGYLTFVCSLFQLFYLPISQTLGWKACGVWKVSDEFILCLIICMCLQQFLVCLVDLVGFFLGFPFRSGCGGWWEGG